MKCQQAFALDLAAFVVDPSADAWAGFRAHYPGCIDCAAEVAVWDEMQTFLRSGGPGTTTVHPPKELLLRYAEHRASLSAIEAALVGKHLASCRTCPDELAALRTFDFSVVSPAMVPHVPRWGAVARAMVASMRSLVLHPAVAYALVLLLLYPAVMQLRLVARGVPTTQIADERQVAADAGRPTEASASAERDLRDRWDAEAQAPPPVRADAPAEPAVAHTTQQANGASQLAAASTRPPRATARRTQPAGAAAHPDRATDDARRAPQASVDGRDHGVSDERKPTEPSGVVVQEEEPVDERADADEPRVLGLAESGEPHDEAREAREAEKDTHATEGHPPGDAFWSAIVLAPGRTPTVERADLRAGIVLRLPPADRAVEIRVLGPGGEEAARETVPSPAGDPVEVRLPATKLVLGTYRVLTRPLDRGAASAPISELSFIVR